MKTKSLKGIFVSLTLALSVFFAGCSMDIEKPVYSWSLGSDKASFTVTSVKQNGVEQLTESYKYKETSYSPELTNYLTYYFDSEEYTTVTFTIENYVAYGTDDDSDDIEPTAYNQWVAFLTTGNAEQWILRPDHYSNAKINSLSNVYYEGNAATPNTYLAGTYGDTSLWNGKLTIKMVWNPLTEVASVHVSKTDDPTVYYYSSASKDAITKRVTLGSDNATFTVESAKLSMKGSEQELLATPLEQKNLAYWDFGNYLMTSIPGSEAFTLTYKLTEYTAGAEVYNNFVTILFDSDENKNWALRADNWSNESFTNAPAYTGTTNSYATPDMYNCTGDVYDTVTVSFDGEATYTVKAWRSDDESVYYEASSKKQ